MVLSAAQLRELRRSAPGPAGNRLAKAIELAGISKQADLADAIGFKQPYVSDVTRGRHATITVDNAYKFADFFGCLIEDLFPRQTEAA